MMKKKKFHKNSKGTVSKKNNLNEGVKDLGRNVLIDKIILILYLAVAFIPSIKALDVMFTQWYYVAILNISTLGYVLMNKKSYSLSINSKRMKYVLLGMLLFVFLALISMFKSISISESLMAINYLISTIMAFYIFYLVIKDNPKKYFEFVASVLLIFLVIESLQVIYHFMIKNGGEPRSNELFKGLNPTYGNRNILAASVIIKMSFAFYLFYTVKDNVKYIVSLVSIYLAVLAILLIGARTPIYGLPIILLTLLLGSIVINKKDSLRVQFKKYLIPVLIVAGFSFVSSLSINKIHQEKLNTLDDLIFTKPKEKLYKTNIRTASLVSDSGRKKYWVAAIDGFKSSPIIGVGIGNWKLIEKKELIKARRTSSFFYPRRVHNDFLQVLSEVGIFGFVLFVSLFVLVYFVLIKTILRRKGAYEVRLMSLICLGAFMAYTLDALINFPGERPPIQMLGVLVMLFSLLLVKKDENKFQLPKYSKLILGLTVVVVVFFSEQIYRSSKLQRIMRSSLYGKKVLTDTYSIKYDDMNNSLPSYPTLNAIGRPIDYSKSLLAYSEGKYIQTFEHLEKAIKESPYSLEHYAFKSLIYRSNKVYRNMDSSIYYAKKVFDARPGSINQYNILRLHYENTKDTLKLLDLITRHNNFIPKNKKAWVDKANFYLKYYKNKNKAEEVLDSAKLLNPDKKSIQDLKLNIARTKKNDSLLKVKNLLRSHSVNGAKFFAAKKYKEAYKEYKASLKIDEDNYKMILNLSLAEIKLKRYHSAIKNLTKVINSGINNTGKPEYNRGLCYMRIGNKKRAGIDFRESLKRGYAMAKKLDVRILKY